MESIYNWIKAPPIPEEKPPMYRSTLPESSVPCSTIRDATRVKATGIIGRQQRETISPRNFLRAHELTSSGIDPNTLPAKFQRPDQPRKPAVPTQSSLESSQTAGQRHAPKDYVEANAVDAMLTQTRRPQQPEVDWLSKPDYGKVPEYLSTIKSTISIEKEIVKSQVSSSRGGKGAHNEDGNRVREMPQAERDELLAALRKRYDEVMSKYQLISYRNISTSTSTLGEIRYKETFEKQLVQLEADIKRLSVNGPIMIVDDAE